MALAALAFCPGAGMPAAAAELQVRGAHAPPWSHAIASPGDDWINDLLPLANGNVVAVGFLNRDDDAAGPNWVAVAAELSTAGSLVSDRRYGLGGGLDAFWSMLEAPGGKRMFAGFTTRLGEGGIDGLALLAEPDGTMISEHGFGGSGYDRFTDVSEAGDGFAFLGHSQLAESDRRRVFLLKTDRHGKEQWRRLFEGPGTWAGLYIEPAGDGGFVIAGGVSEAGANADMFVIRTDGEGRELWRKRIGTAEWDEINHGLVVRADGSIVLVGYAHPAGAEANDLVAATLDRHGQLVRLERFGGSGDERARLPRLGADGRIWIIGHSDSAGAGGSDALIVALDREGGFTDEVILLGGPADDVGTAILPLQDGSLMIAAYSDKGEGRGEDAFVAAIDPETPAGRHSAFRRTIVKPAR